MVTRVAFGVIFIGIITATSGRRLGAPSEVEFAQEKQGSELSGTNIDTDSKNLLCHCNRPSNKTYCSPSGFERCAKSHHYCMAVVMAGTVRVAGCTGPEICGPSSNSVICCTTDKCNTGVTATIETIQYIYTATTVTNTPDEDLQRNTLTSANWFHTTSSAVSLVKCSCRLLLSLLLPMTVTSLLTNNAASIDPM